MAVYEACGIDLKTLSEKEWECMALDFADAFKQLRVDAKEVKHLGGRALDGKFAYRVVRFGVRSGPLVWGRVAALIMRRTAALNADRNKRIVW